MKWLNVDMSLLVTDDTTEADIENAATAAMTSYVSFVGKAKINGVTEEECP